jgi:hypothetical protein
MLPLQPPAWHDHEAERVELLEALGLPEDHQFDPEDLEPWWLID